MTERHKTELLDLSEAGLALIQRHEGLRLAAYVCPGGKWTIGYGHTAGVQAGDVISERRAIELLNDDVKASESAVRRLVKVPMAPAEFDALVSWTFNLGAGNLAASTLLRRLNAGRYDDVPAEMARWNKATQNGRKVTLPGLVKRRADEAAMWASAADATNASAAPASVERETLVKSKTMQASVAGMAGAATAAGGLLSSLGSLHPTAQAVIAGGLVLVAVAVLVVMRERVAAWAEGWR